MTGTQYLEIGLCPLSSGDTGRSSVSEETIRGGRNEQKAAHVGNIHNSGNLYHRFIPHQIHVGLGCP